jgi:hypothetical protein
MGRTVIQHQKRARKRANPRAWVARRLGALVVTAAGLAAATWLSITLLRPTAPPAGPATAPQAALPALPPAEAALVDVNVALDLALPPPARPRRARQDAGVPLDASAERISDGYEILSASELASISQARD